MKGVILLFLTFFSVITFCSAVDVSAKSAILYEPETETVLFQKNIDIEREIASTTKIMTAVVVLENAELWETVTVPKCCTEIEGTSLYLREGEELTIEELLYGLMLKSGNDAAVALADFVGFGDVSAFVDMMNQKATEIGMADTHFKNPSGLPDENHISTARDMAKLAAYAMENPEFLKIVSTKEKNITGRALKNHNKLLWMYDSANGIKTGFTKVAGRCLVTGAKRDNMQLVAVTLSAPDDWNDHMAMFDYGFENFTLYSELMNEGEVTSLPVVGGAENFTDVLMAEDTRLLIKKSDGDLERKIILPRFLYAPVLKGQEVGKIIYKTNGKIIKTTPLICGDSVGYYEKENLFERFFKFLKKV